MAIIKKYLVKVDKVINHSNDIFSVELKSENKKFRYKPGQFFHLALDSYDPSQPWPESRCFSIGSSDNENLLKFTYAIKGKFTKRMENEIKEGLKVWVKMPYGELFSNIEDKNNCVFIAGGTGISPFLSLFCNDRFKEYNNPKFYFGLKKQSLNFYKDELKKSLTINENFKYKIIFENEKGCLDIKKIYINNKDKTYFISGPPLMIKNFKEFFIKNGLNEHKIKTDEWE